MKKKFAGLILLACTGLGLTACAAQPYTPPNAQPENFRVVRVSDTLECVVYDDGNAGTEMDCERIIFPEDLTTD